LDYPFPFDSGGGRKPYLSDEDAQQLRSRIIEARLGYVPLNTPDVLEQAFVLKIRRLDSAVAFLAQAKCPRIADGLLQKGVVEPSRTWLNRFAEAFDLKLKYSRPIVTDRFSNGTRTKLSDFFEKFESLIRSFPPHLIFGADETMVDLNKVHKSVVDSSASISIEEMDDKISLISVMLSHRAAGRTVPPFVIPPKLQQAAFDMASVMGSFEVWVASSANGWQTREMFFLWSANFCHWLTRYRECLPDHSMRRMPSLSILDGHISRQCPAALKIFQFFNVFVLILPSHTSHILQMFDSGLASPVRQALSAIYRRLRRTDLPFPDAVARLRYAAVMAVLQAWKGSASISNCEMSARKAGIWPWNPEAVLSGRFIVDDEIARLVFPQRRSRSFLDINSSVITTPDAINTIRDGVTKSSPLFRLTDFNAENGYVEEFVRVADLALKNCRLFTPFESLLILSEHGPAELCDIQAAFHMIHERSIPRFSHIAMVRASYILTQPDELSDFDIICHVCTGSLYDVFKVRSKADGQILCLKTIKHDFSKIFEVQGTDECMGKLCSLNNSRTEKIKFMTRSNSTRPGDGRSTTALAICSFGG
jgi:hypothetical protein